VEGNGGDSSAKLTGMEWWEILAICIACAVVLVFIIIFSICVVVKRRRKNEDQNDRRIEPQRRAPNLGLTTS